MNRISTEKIRVRAIGDWSIKFLFLLAIYVAIGISLTAIDPTSTSSKFWLSGGVAVGLLSRWSVRLIPAVLLGSLITYDYVGLSFTNNALLSVAHILGIITFFGILWFANIKPNEITERKHTSLFFISTLLSMLIPAVFGMIFLDVTEGRCYVFFFMWLSAVAGILLGAKFTVEINVRNFFSAVSGELFDVWFLVLTTIIIGLVISNYFVHTIYVFDFLCFILLTFACLKYGSLLSRFIAIAIIIIAIYKSNSGEGIYPILDRFDSDIYLLSFIGCITLLGFFIGNAREVTLEITLEIEKLKRDKEIQVGYLNAVFQLIPDLLVEVDQDNNCIAANGSASVELLSPSTLIGVNLKNIMPTDSYQVWCKAIDEATSWNISQGRVIEIVENNKSHWFELSITKRTIDNAQKHTFICIARDITKRLENHSADLANEKRFRNIFDNVDNISVQGYNRNHEVIYWNAASEKLYGYTKEEALGQKLEDLIIPPHISVMVHNDIEKWHLDGVKIPTSELALRDKKGNTVFVYSNHIMIDTPNEREMFCIDIDIGHQRRALAKAEEELSHRKFTETSLRESERNFKRAQVMGNIALWSWSPEHNTYSINEIALKFLNIQPHHLNGDMQYFIDKFIVDDDRGRFVEAFEKCVNGKSNLEIDVAVVIDKQPYKFMIKGQQIEKEGINIIDGIIQRVS